MNDTDFTFISLALTAAVIVLCVVVGFYIGRTRCQKWTISWLIFDAYIHLVMEGYFLYNSIQGRSLNKVKGNDLLILQWREYIKIDKRFGNADPLIVSMEVWMVLLCGPIALVLCYAIVKDKAYRHFLQITLCVLELFAGFMTFFPEWLQGKTFISRDDPLHVWFNVIFFNGLFVVVPLLLLWHSFEATKFVISADGEAEIQKDVITETYTTKVVTHNYNTRSKKKD